MSESVLMSSPDFGVSLNDTGLSVTVNPNPVQIEVLRGPQGKTLKVSAMGVSIGVALPSDAAQHLAALLSWTDCNEAA